MWKNESGRMREWKKESGRMRGSKRDRERKREEGKKRKRGRERSHDLTLLQSHDEPHMLVLCHTSALGTTRSYYLEHLYR